MNDAPVTIVNAADLYINPWRKVRRTMRERWLSWPWQPWRAWTYEPAIKIAMGPIDAAEAKDSSRG